MWRLADQRCDLIQACCLVHLTSFWQKLHTKPPLCFWWSWWTDDTHWLNTNLTPDVSICLPPKSISGTNVSKYVFFLNLWFVKNDLRRCNWAQSTVSLSRERERVWHAEMGQGQTETLLTAVSTICFNASAVPAQHTVSTSWLMNCYYVCDNITYFQSKILVVCRTQNGDVGYSSWLTDWPIGWLTDLMLFLDWGHTVALSTGMGRSSNSWDKPGLLRGEWVQWVAEADVGCELCQRHMSSVSSETSTPESSQLSLLCVCYFYQIIYNQAFGSRGAQTV